MNPGLPHLIMVPVLLPLLTAAVMMLLGEKRRRLKVMVNVASTLAGLFVALALLRWVDVEGEPGVIGVYLASNWEAPFGIVLAVDRLSALMLVLTSVVGLAAVTFSSAGWHRAGVHFHPLFQLQLMGLNGAFLTADLFNLFVFFEVMLTASYGLLLHGSGWRRVKSGLHYIAVNLLASALFLIGTAMLYGVLGTLNLADLAQKVPLVTDEDRGLLHAGAALLATAFLAKAAMWPVSFWLAPAYSSATTPVAAIFTLMTKVGVYATLRMWTLLFPATAGASALFGAEMLTIGGLATIAFGCLGLMASQQVGRIAAFGVIASSGTLLAALSFSSVSLTAGALFYLVSSTLAASALFLLVDPIERARQGASAVPLPGLGGFEADEDTNLDDEEEALFGRAIPAAMAFLGLAFIASTLLLSGLPPLSGFVAKLTMLTALLNPNGLGEPSAATTGLGWALFVLLIVSGLASMLTLSRAGIQHFWAPQDRPSPRLRVVEGAPIALLILACVVLTVRAEPVMRYASATAASLHAPTQYIDAVMSAKPQPPPEGDAP